jgi:hypothetical protein
MPYRVNRIVVFNGDGTRTSFQARMPDKVYVGSVQLFIDDDFEYIEGSVVFSLAPPSGYKVRFFYDS